MFSDDDIPPSYGLDELLPLPTYSVYPAISERLLQSEPLRMSGCPACDWVVESKHMSINMGYRAWGLHAPSYGLNGKVEGYIKFVVGRGRVERVTATLEGYIKTTLTQRGAFAGDAVQPIMSQTIALYDSSTPNSFDWDAELPFSITIPPHIDIRGRTLQTPPSFFCCQQNFVCEVSYNIKFNMLLKGKGLKKHASKMVPILYLPKSMPPQPPLMSIPRPLQAYGDAALFLQMFDRVKTVTLCPSRLAAAKFATSTQDLQSFNRSVYLSLPSPLCFTSGEMIPFTLSLIFPDQPVLAKLLTKNIRIQLLKRIMVWRKGLLDAAQRDILISTAQLRHNKEYSEGVILLKGVIQAGNEGLESSWKLDEVAEVRYIIRVILIPPKSLAMHVPSFRHEEMLEVTTDYWGTVGRELNSTGGTPTPALGLARQLRR